MSDPARGRRRRLALGLRTLLGGRAQGFFIPYRYAAAVRPFDYPALEPRFAAAQDAFREVLAAIEALAPELCRMRGPPPQPRFDQGWFPRLDAAAAYTLVRRRAPARILEVGSGHSTRFLARAIADGGLASALTCIDPAPRATLDGLPVRRLERLLEDVPETEFAALAAGDILFVDSSHVLMPGSDVDRLLNRILPALAPGVMVHLHDIFLPDAYPASWAWRGYNEQQAVAALLQGGAYAIQFASHYVATRLAGRVASGVLAELPRLADAPESSLWLVKRG
jgi:predicted O-methyltransferase YrrM